jgi:tetratricopeptide (TPR) repeat protein
VDNSDSADLALFLDASLADLAIPLLSLIGSHEPGEIFAGWLSRQGTKALVSYALGIIAQKKGLHEQAQNLHNEGFLVREQVSDPDQRAGILFLEGMIVHSQKLYDEAYSLFEESLSVAQKTMNSKLQASTLYRLGLITQEKGIYREAQRLYEESLALKPNEVEPIIGLNELCFLLREPGNIASIDILERVLSNLKRYINKEDNPNAQRRPEEQKIWQWLYEIIQDINTVQTSRSLLKRTTALNHAVGLLADPLQQTGISQVGKLLIKRVTDRWSTEIARAATRLGKLSVTEYVGSPYMFAPPVTGKALIGRDDIFKRITSLWARPGQRNSLLIYGHRRMGKTSIAQALTSRCNLGDDTKLIYLSLEGQPLQHEGDLYYPLAFRFWQRFKENLDKPEKADFDGDNARVKFDSFLAILNEYIQSGRCVLVLDEFEALYKRLGPLKADETIKYLRAQIVTYAWLALALVGLSDLNDLRLSYNSSLLGWVGIRVGFLDHEQVKMILANPPQAPDFPLDFTPEALEFIAMHTNGQPYLVQVIGDQLVQRYNQMVFVEQREHSGIFNEEDVQEILKDPDFYSTAAAYFDGVWEQATKGQPGEVTLLRVLAKNTDGMDESTLREVADLDETIFMKSLQALIHHDVLCNKNGRVHYTVPLMYRWVQNMCPKE